MEQFEFNTPDGRADGYYFHPEGDGKFPLILFYMDAFGPRDALFKMAERLTSHGFAVFLPNLYYRLGEYLPFDTKTAFNPGPERERIMVMLQSLSIEKVITDTASLIEFLGKEEKIDINRIGCLGYCMGGKFALAAAYSFPGKVLAAASIHGGGLVTEHPDSPHLMAPGIKAKVYIGIATNDRSFTELNQIQLEDAFRSAKVNARKEIYPGALHGFSIRDSSVYNKQASELHWERILQLFKETLVAPGL